MSGYCGRCGHQICICKEKVKEKQKDLYLRCGCGCEVLHIERDSEYDSYYVSIYSMPGTFPWMQKLRQIWKIIKTSSPYSDQFVLNEVGVGAIKEFLNEESDIPKRPKRPKGQMIKESKEKNLPR